MRTVNLILTTLVITSLIAITSITFLACSKSNPDNSPRGLIARKPWRFVQSVTVYLDTSNKDSASKTQQFTDCATTITTKFSLNGHFSVIDGCPTPISSYPKTSYTWTLDDNNLIVFDQSGPPRSGYRYTYTDSIITLTADSMILVTHPMGWDYPLNHEYDHRRDYYYYIH